MHKSNHHSLIYVSEIFMLKACERTKCFAAPLWTNCLQTSGAVVKVVMMVMIVTVEGFGKMIPLEIYWGAKMGLTPIAWGPDRSPCLECNLPAICRPRFLCLIFKQTPVKSPCLISQGSWKLAKISTSFLHQEQDGGGGKGFFKKKHTPTICACDKYRFLWRPWKDWFNFPLKCQRTIGL